MTPARSLDLAFHLTERDEAILDDLEQFRLLTTRQIQRLRLPAAPFGDHATVSAATRGTTRILNRLEALGAVARLERRIGGIKHGSALTIWHLGPTGDRYLRRRDGRSARRQYLEPGYLFIQHTLAIAEAAVALREHAHTGRFDVLELETEPSCWRTFTGPGGNSVTLKPDLLVVTADRMTETHSFVEVDRGTEHISPTLLQKCHRYQQYQRTGIEQQQRGLVPAVVWIVPNQKRARALREAIRTDRVVDPTAFWVIVPEQTLAQLAPYPPLEDAAEPNTTTQPKGGIS